MRDSAPVAKVLFSQKFRARWGMGIAGAARHSPGGPGVIVRCRPAAAGRRVGRGPGRGDAKRFVPGMPPAAGWTAEGTPLDGAPICGRMLGAEKPRI